MGGWLLTFLLTSQASATTVIVPFDQPTLTDAVASLSGAGPHEVLIYVDDLYEEVGTLDIGTMDVTFVGTGIGNSTVRVTDPLADAVFRVNGGTLTLQDLSVTGDETAVTPDLNNCLTPTDRRAIDATAATVVVLDSELSCFVSQQEGGAIAALDSDLTLDGVTLVDNLAWLDGGHVWVGGPAAGVLTITNSDFDAGQSIGRGGALAFDGGDVLLEGNQFTMNEALGDGGAVWGTGATAPVEIWDNEFHSNVGYDPFNDLGTGGGVSISGADVDIWNNDFCQNSARDGGGLALHDPTNAVVENNTFNSNWATLGGGGMYVGATATMPDPIVWNNTFYRNSAGVDLYPSYTQLLVGAGGAAMFDGTQADVQNNLISDQRNGGGVAALVGANYGAGDPWVLVYNLWYGNCDLDGCDKTDPLQQLHLAGDVAGHAFTVDDVVDLDPLYTQVGGAGDCLTDALFAMWGSPSVNAGNPDVTFADVDGTRNDIGYTGGQRAPSADNDGDGVMGTLDCDDSDYSINPFALEVCDGEDNDCDGVIDEGSPIEWYQDDDGDGYGTGPVIIKLRAAAQHRRGRRGLRRRRTGGIPGRDRDLRRARQRLQQPGRRRAGLPGLLPGQRLRRLRHHRRGRQRV